MRKLIDRLQVWLYLTGFTRIAALLGRWGTPALPSVGSEDDRITLPYPIETQEFQAVEPHEYWTTDDFHPAEPLIIHDFDPTFNSNPGIDPTRDVLVPQSKLDVN